MNADLKKLVKEFLIAVAVLVAIGASLYLVYGTPNPFYVVSSGSMIPALLEFDILVVNSNVPFEEIEVGDIIVFNHPSGIQRVIVHRVVAVIDDDPLTIRTKGDANPSSIPGVDFPIREKEYIGEVMHVVPQVGYITRILMPPINYLLAAVIIGLIAFRYYRRKRHAPTLDQEDEPNVVWDDPDAGRAAAPESTSPGEHAKQKDKGDIKPDANNEKP